MDELKYERCIQLFGEDFIKLTESKVLILGIGGVGSFVLDCLYRTGIKNITIIDKDVYDESNQNRQIGSEAVGEVKVLRLAELYSGVIPLHQHIDAEFISSYDMDRFDIVVDAIDDMSAKVEIAKKVSHKLISSTGSARKTDPTKIQSASIWKTHGDKLAKKFRYELKKSGFKGDFTALFSDEDTTDSFGSFVGVTGSFGLAVCSEVIAKLRNNKK